jgi:very-short-patch-repair endonuclease
MNPKLSTRADAHGGVVSHADVLACGYTESQLRERLKAGTWMRLRRGYYAARPDMEALPPWEIDKVVHRLHVRAAARALGSAVVVSHQSAAVLHDVRLWGIPVGEVQVTRLDGRTCRVRAGVRFHVGQLSDSSVTMVDGVVVTTPARALVELACVRPYEIAVIAVDSALRQRLTTQEELRDALDVVECWPGSGTAKAAVAFADGRSESVGESRLRVLMDNQGLPKAALQTRFGTAADNVIARVDFYLREFGVVVEFDGLVKYRDTVRNTVLAEKVREDRLREMGLVVVRVTWDELADPAAVGWRIRRAMELAAARRTA